MTRPARGFTLVEMLVAIAVTSVLVGLVYGTVRIGQRSADAVESLARGTEARHIGWEFLYRAVSNTRAVPDPDEPENRTGFVGESTRLRLIADMPGYVVPGGLAQIDVGAQAIDQRQQLTVAYTRYDVTSDAARDDRGFDLEAVLVEDLAAVEIEYLGNGDESADPGWRATWDDPDRLPSLIRIWIAPSKGRPWPAIVARPIADTELIDEDLAASGTDRGSGDVLAAGEERDAPPGDGR